MKLKLNQTQAIYPLEASKPKVCVITANACYIGETQLIFLHAHLPTPLHQTFAGFACWKTIKARILRNQYKLYILKWKSLN